MSVLFTHGPEEAACEGKIFPDPVRRLDSCAYRAEYVAVPSERPYCSDHIVDFLRSRPITSFDVARAHCADCLAVQRGEHERKREERRGRLRGGGEKAPAVPRARGREEQWCGEHDDVAQQHWLEQQTTKARRR